MRKIYKQVKGTPFNAWVKRNVKVIEKKYPSVKYIDFIVADQRRGVARLYERQVILPAWLAKHKLWYKRYVLIHEIAHMLTRTNHDEYFYFKVFEMWDKLGYNLDTQIKMLHAETVYKKTAMRSWRKYRAEHKESVLC